MEDTRPLQRRQKQDPRTSQDGRSKTHSIALLLEEIERLKATVQELRVCSEELEAERQRLLRENRHLRREITLSRLIEDLEDSIEAVDRLGADEQDATPPSAERLYQQLPTRFPFPAFFQIAEEAGLQTETARRCLTHFLHEGLLMQTGAQLQKSDGAMSSE